jgi:hypothetical protein
MGGPQSASSGPQRRAFLKAMLTRGTGAPRPQYWHGTGLPQPVILGWPLPAGCAALAGARNRSSMLLIAYGGEGTFFSVDHPHGPGSLMEVTVATGDAESLTIIAPPLLPWRPTIPRSEPPDQAHASAQVTLIDPATAEGEHLGCRRKRNGSGRSWGANASCRGHLSMGTAGQTGPELPS